jgi:hypothetical protein
LDFKRRGKLPIHLSRASKTYSEKFHGPPKIFGQSLKQRRPREKVSQILKNFSPARIQ